MALDTIWIAIASILTVFDITKAVDENGDIVTPEVKLNPGSIRWAVFHFSDRTYSDLVCHIVILHRLNAASSRGRSRP